MIHLTIHILHIDILPITTYKEMPVISIQFHNFKRYIVDLIKNISLYNLIWHSTYNKYY